MPSSDFIVFTSGLLLFVFLSICLLVIVARSKRSNVDEPWITWGHELGRRRRIMLRGTPVLVLSSYQRKKLRRLEIPPECIVVEETSSDGKSEGNTIGAGGGGKEFGGEDDKSESSVSSLGNGMRPLSPSSSSTSGFPPAGDRGSADGSTSPRHTTGLRNRARGKSAWDNMKSRINSTMRRRRRRIFRSVPDLLENKTPLLVFVNPKSGGQRGQMLLFQLRALFHEKQVYDIINDGGPKRGLKFFRNVPSFRIVVCGGDGTVAWVLSTLDELEFEYRPPVAVFPMGTGNDMARVLGWGGGADVGAGLFSFAFNRRRKERGRSPRSMGARHRDDEKEK